MSKNFIFKYMICGAARCSEVFGNNFVVQCSVVSQIKKCLWAVDTKFCIRDITSLYKV